MIKKGFFLSFICLLWMGCKNRHNELMGVWSQQVATPTIEGFCKVDSMVFGEENFEWYYKVFENSSKQKQVFVLKQTGKWICEGRNEADPDFTDIKFIFDKKTITLMDTSAKVMDAYYFRICYLPFNQEVDITNTGCAVIAPINDMPNVYQIAKYEENQMKIGEYNLHELPDNPDARPKKVGQNALLKFLQ